MLTIQDIEQYLKEAKDLVRKNKCLVSPREKNLSLIAMYQFNEDDYKKVILSLEPTDFCKTVNNDNEKFKDEILYIFRKEKLLKRRDGNENIKVPLYIKINKLHDHILIIVSFHEMEHTLKYAFK